MGFLVTKIVTNRLTARRVQTESSKGYHLDGRGLYLQVTAGGGKSWVYRYTLRGVTRDMGLGSTSTLSLAEARESATEQRKLVAHGVDPIDARNARMELVEHTFDKCSREYIKANASSWKSAKTLNQWEQSLKDYVSPVFGSVPVNRIGLTHLIKALNPIWTTKTETATRVRQRVEAVLDWATVHKYRSGDNPARWNGNLNKVFPSPLKVMGQRHFPALPYADLPSFYAEVCKQEGAAPLCLRLTILTCSRTAETTGMTWEEIDLEDRSWTISGDRMKAGKEHSVPLSDEAVSILLELRKLRNTGYVFQYRDKHLSNNAMLSLLARMGHGGITVHGFRSTFNDWAMEKTDFQNEVIQMALAHTVGNKVEAAYRRGSLLEKRRALSDAWAAYCTGQKKAPHKGGA